MPSRVRAWALEIGRQGRMQSGRGRLKVTLLELGETEIELHAGKLGIKSESFSVGGRCVGIILLLGEHHAQAGEGCGVVGVASGDRLPGLGSFGQLALLLEGDRV